MDVIAQVNKQIYGRIENSSFGKYKRLNIRIHT